MVEFLIDVIINPASAVASQKKVSRALDKTEKEALQLKNTLDKALATRSAGLLSSLSNVNKRLKDTESLARSAAESVETIGGGSDPFQEELASIRAQTEEIKLRNAAEASIGQTLQIEANLRTQNRMLTAAETKELLTAVSQQQKLNQAVRQRAAIQKSLQTVQARTRDLEIQVLKVSNARKDALREANRLRSEGVKLTSIQINKLEREFAKQRNLTTQIEKSSQAQMRLTGGTSIFGTVARRAFAGIGIALVVRQLGRMSDSFLALQNRLRTIIPNQNELNSTFDKLVGIANLTRTEIDSVVQLYQRGSLAAKELGASQAELLLFTERVGKALAVQGGSAASSSGALLQLSQALSSGIVRAEEFNSILEGAFPIAQAAARGIDGFGGSVSKLRNAIIKGQITSEVFFRGFLKGSKETAEQFERTSSTIGGAFTVLGNNATVLVGKFSDSTGAASAFTDSVRLIADNLPQAIFTVSALSVAIGVKYVVSAVAATAATGGLNTALLLTAGRMALVTASFAVATASVIFLSNKLQRFNSDMEELGKNLRNLEEDGKFLTNLGSSISSAQREINNLNRTIAEQTERGVASENQLARIKELRARIAAARGEIAEETAENEKSRVAQEKLNLAREAAVSATKRQEELLKTIREPMEKLIQLQGDLNALVDEGSLSQKKANEFLAAAKPKERKAIEKNPFKDQIVSLQKLNQELEIRATKTGIQQKADLIVLDLNRQQVTVTVQRRERIEELLAIQQNLTKELAKQKKLEQDRKDTKKADEREVERIEDLKKQVDVIGQLKIAEQELIDLQNMQKDVVIPGLQEAIQDMRLRQLDASKELGDGFTRAFARIAQEAEDLAAVGEAVVNVFADNATDALVEFAQTGQFEFKQFANAILDDLIRIIARLLIVQGLSAVTGGTSGLLSGGGGVNTGFEHGGTVQPGQRPRPVGESGEELFTPNKTGTITPNPASVQQQPPQLNVTLITVESEDMIGEALASGRHDEVLIQRMGENSDRLNQVTS